MAAVGCFSQGKQRVDGFREEAAHRFPEWKRDDRFFTWQVGRRKKGGCDFLPKKRGKRIHMEKHFFNNIKY